MLQSRSCATRLAATHDTLSILPTAGLTTGIVLITEQNCHNFRICGTATSEWIRKLDHAMCCPLFGP